MKKLTLEGNPFNQICVYFSFISFLFLGISHVDLTVKFPSALPIHQEISSIYKSVSGLILLTMCTIISSDNLLLSFCISYSPSLIKSHTNNFYSTALSLSIWYRPPLSPIVNQKLEFPTFTCHYMLCSTSSISYIIFLHTWEAPYPLAMIGWNFL